jgi:hypothetical protein
VTRDRCYDFLNIFAEKFSEKLVFLTQNKGKSCKIFIITKNANFFAENCQKLQKIVIITSTPDWAKMIGRIFAQRDDCLLWAGSLKFTEVVHIFCNLFPRLRLCINCDKIWVGLHFGQCFSSHCWSGHPAAGLHTEATAIKHFRQ